MSCPCCHARFSVEAALQDDAARELLALLAPMQPTLTRPLMSYLGLFRAANRALAWDRSLRLCRETLGLTTSTAALELALVETVAAIDEKRSQPGWKPLTAHNYLRRVLESVEARQAAGAVLVPADAAAPAKQPSSRAGQALVALQGMKRD